MLAVQGRRDRLDAAIGELAATPAWAPVVARLGCLGGIGVLTSFGLVVEIGDWQRFTGAWIGAWCPASSPAAAGAAKGRSPDRQQPRSPAAGRWRPGTTATPIGPASSSEPAMAGQPAQVRERPDHSNHRLHQRWCRLDARAKRSTSSVVAVARELAGWCWSRAVLET